MKSSKYLNYIIIGVSFLYLLYISWFRWGNLTIDALRGPWWAYRIARGSVIYRDFPYIFGFFPLYFASFLYKLFGVHINCFIFLGILVTLVSSAFIYKISRLFLNRALSTLVVLNFLFVFAFGCYSYTCIFNFILPYGLPSTFFIMFVLSALHFFINFIRKEKYKYFFWWGISMCFAFSSRIWLSLLVWIAFVLISSIYAYRKRKFSVIAYTFLPLLLSFILYWVFLYINNGFSGFKESVIDGISVRSRGKREMYIAGLYNVSNNLVVVFKSFSFQLLAAASLYLANTALSSIVKKLKIAKILGYIIAGLLSVGITACLLKFMHYFTQYRLMPILLILGIAVYAFKLFFDKRVNNHNNLSLLMLFFVAFILTLRVLLRASPNHNSFFLLIPGLICYYIFFIDLLPSFFNKFVRVNDKLKNYYFLSLFIMFILLGLPFIKYNHNVYNKKNCFVVTSRGKIGSFCDRHTRRFWEAVSYLNKNTPKDSKVFVFPQGEGINFFSGRDNPTRYRAFYPVPNDIINEGSVIEELDKHGVNYILIINRVFYEYGNARFGIDYAKKVYSWILDNYQMVKLIGPYPFTSPEFGIAIFKRK